MKKRKGKNPRALKGLKLRWLEVLYSGAAIALKRLELAVAFVRNWR